MNEMVSYFKRIRDAIWKSLKDFWNTLISYPESLLILILATVGLSWLIGRLPFMAQLPAFVESKMFAPAMSSAVIIGIVAYMKWKDEYAIS
jgi:hypothetical protein